MQELISALKETIDLLEGSEDSALSNQGAGEARSILEKELASFTKTQKFTFFGKSKIKFLFMPTGALQEISISNNWGDEYLRISEIVDKYIE
jgi:hypothetical protein